MARALRVGRPSSEESRIVDYLDAASVVVELVHNPGLLGRKHSTLHRSLLRMGSLDGLVVHVDIQIVKVEAAVSK